MRYGIFLVHSSIAKKLLEFERDHPEYNTSHSYEHTWEYTDEYMGFVGAAALGNHLECIEFCVAENLNINYNYPEREMTLTACMCRF